MYATSIRNKYTPAKFMNKETPFQRFFHRHGCIKILKTCGCASVIYFPLQNRKKCDESSECGVLVGSSEGVLC